MTASHTSRTILLAGASRGLGLGLVEEFLSRGWHVVATARALAKAAELQRLRAAHPDRLSLETLDIADSDSVKALATALAGRPIDVLFAVAGISTQGNTPIQDFPADKIAQEFVTNATAPIVLAETLLGQMAKDGKIAFMTSILGSLASNAGGGLDVYRASKAALNMLAMNFALRHKERPVLLFHPGWVRTEMGGPGAHLDVQTSVKGLADQIERPAKAGIAYLDYQGQTLPW